MGGPFFSLQDLNRRLLTPNGFMPIRNGYFNKSMISGSDSTISSLDIALNLPAQVTLGNLGPENK
jgi:hypothetical protein